MDLCSPMTQVRATRSEECGLFGVTDRWFGILASVERAACTWQASNEKRRAN